MGVAVAELGEGSVTSCVLFNAVVFVRVKAFVESVFSRRPTDVFQESSQLIGFADI